MTTWDWKTSDRTYGPEPDLSFPMRSSYWRQYESDGDMRISAQLAQMRSPPGLGERRLECEAV